MSVATMFLQLVEGMGITVEIFFLTLLFSLPLGLFISFGRMSNNILLRGIAKIYISVMRGTPMMLQLLNQMQQSQMQMMELMQSMRENNKAKETKKSSEPSLIRPMSSPVLEDEAGDGQENRTNQEMLMKVPLEISVEIGRTKRLVKDILEFTQGTLVVLDKMAGEQVDLFVNGQCIARGDIVVVEDNFGIRITEIMKVNLAALE